MADEQNHDTPLPDVAADAGTASGNELDARIQVLEEELATAQDQAMRIAADKKNERRRAEQDEEPSPLFLAAGFRAPFLTREGSTMADDASRRAGGPPHETP